MVFINSKLLFILRFGFINIYFYIVFLNIVNCNSERLELDISELKQGIYFIIINDFKKPVRFIKR